MPGKPITLEGLQRDLEYTLNGTIFHEVLYRICPPRSGLEVLEPGCGSGKFGLAYALQGANVILLDIDIGVLQYTIQLRDKLDLEVAAERAPKTFRYPSIFNGSIVDLSNQFSVNRFDFVYCEGVMHHWPREDPRRQGGFDQMVAVTKPGGIVAHMASNAHCPAMMEYARTIKHTYEDMPETQTPFSMAEIAECLKKAGLTDIHVAPVESPDWARARTLVAWGRKP